MTAANSSPGPWRPGKLREGKLWRTHDRIQGSRWHLEHAVARYAARAERIALMQRATAALARETVLMEAVLGRGEVFACIWGSGARWPRLRCTSQAA